MYIYITASDLCTFSGKSWFSVCLMASEEIVVQSCGGQQRQVKIWTMHRKEGETSQPNEIVKVIPKSMEEMCY